VSHLSQREIKTYERVFDCSDINKAVPVPGKKDKIAPMLN